MDDVDVAAELGPLRVAVVDAIARVDELRRLVDERRFGSETHTPRRAGMDPRTRFILLLLGAAAMCWLGLRLTQRARLGATHSA